ncbi:MAG: glycosyltransferase family 4 protein [Planctomycetes bacterium]|nr:glycosyltransferase family 4 protein [Planctomycetota bacterium]
MKVVHIITRMILGGAQENTLLTCRGLHEMPDYDVTLVTGPAIGPEGELLTEAERLGLRVIVVPAMRRAIHPLRDWATVRALRRIVREIRPDIVHTHSSKAGILGRYAARAERVPVVVHTIHGLPFHPYERGWRNALYRWLERKAARWSHKIVCVAEAMTDQAVAAGVADRAKFVTVYSGMETEAFLDCDWQRRAMRYRLGIRDDEFVIGKIARLFELKGYEYVIEAARRIRDAHPNVRFLFVGDGVLRKPLEDQAKRLGVRDWILFAGLVPASQVPTYISAMDALVHASLREGLARVLPQALLAGKPVVSFDVDGAREAVTHGETGYLVPPKSIDGLVASLCELIENPARAAAMAAKGRELCRERFRWQTMVSQLDALYRQLLAGSGPG